MTIVKDEIIYIVILKFSSFLHKGIAWFIQVFFYIALPLTIRECYIVKRFELKSYIGK